MSDFVSVILAAQDENNPDFDEAQATLIKYENQLPHECIAGLIEVLISFSQMPPEEQNQRENTVFLIIGFIKECLKRTLVTENGVETTSLDPELFVNLVEHLRIYFDSANGVLRRAAVNLYSTLFLYKINLFTEMEQPAFINALLTSDNINTVLSGTQFFTDIATDYTINNCDIFASLTEVMRKYADNLEVLQSAIAAIAASISSIEQIMSEEEAQQFILSILGYIDNPQLKHVVYDFYEQVSNNAFQYILAAIPNLLENSINDLQDTQNPVIFSVCDMWLYIFMNESSYIAENSQTEDGSDFQEMIDKFGIIAEHLIPHFIQCLDIVPTDEISSTNTEPYFTIINAFSKIASNYFPVVLPLLEEQISSGSPSNNLIPSICLMVISENLDKYENISDVLEQTISFIQEPSCIGTLFYSLTSLFHLIQFTQDVNPFLEYFDGLLELCQRPELCECVMFCFSALMKCPNFTSFQLLDCFKQIITENLESDFPIVSILKGFNMVWLPNTTPDFHAQAISFLFTLLTECSEKLYHDVCFYLGYILINIPENHPEIFDDGYSILKGLMTNEYYVLPVISSLARHNPDKFKPILLEVVEITKGFLQDERPLIINAGISSFWILYQSIDLSECFHDIFALLLNIISPSSPIEVQSSAIETLRLILINPKQNVSFNSIINALVKYTDIKSLANLELTDSDAFIDILGSLLNIYFTLSHSKLLFPEIPKFIIRLLNIRATLNNYQKQLKKIFDFYDEQLSQNSSLLEAFPYLTSFMDTLSQCLQSTE